MSAEGPATSSWACAPASVVSVPPCRADEENSRLTGPEMTSPQVSGLQPTGTVRGAAGDMLRWAPNVPGRTGHLRGGRRSGSAPGRREGHAPAAKQGDLTVQESCSGRSSASGSLTLTLLTETPPSPSTRRAALRLSTRPEATRASTSGVPAGTDAPGSSAVASCSVRASSACGSPPPNSASLGRLDRVGRRRPVHQRGDVARRAPAGPPGRTAAPRVCRSSSSISSRVRKVKILQVARRPSASSALSQNW